MKRVVTLLTDFGLDDPYVGCMKAVISSHDPSLNVVDVSHGVPAQDLDVAAFWLDHSYAWFARGAVHVCVVDPGVGTARAPIAAAAGDHLFVAPDNGVLSDVLAREPSAAVRRIEPERLGLSVPSRTFHGRDVFAPVAARLASGSMTFAELGPEHKPCLLARTPPAREGQRVIGRIVFVDRFGNLVSDIPERWLDAHVTVAVAERVVRRVGTYADAEPGECVALVSSFGTLEVACRDGHAARLLGVERGEHITLHLDGAALDPEPRS